MAFLANFLMSAFGALLGTVTQYLGKKVAMGATALAFFIALFAGFYLSVTALLTVIKFSVGNGTVLFAMQVFWPPHLTVCISTIFSARITRWVYDETKERARTLLYIT